jgi:hypothetical protein
MMQIIKALTTLQLNFCRMSTKLEALTTLHLNFSYLEHPATLLLSHNMQNAMLEALTTLQLYICTLSMKLEAITAMQLNFTMKCQYMMNSCMFPSDRNRSFKAGSTLSRSSEGTTRFTSTTCTTMASRRSRWIRSSTT